MKKLSSLPFSLCLFLFFNLNAQDLVQIPQDAATLSAAVQLAQSGDTILLSPGVYTDSVHISSKDLVFIGDPNGGSVLSPGVNEKSFVLLDADIEFIHLVFDDFQQNSPPPNFAISATNSNVKIDQCQFNNLFSPMSFYWGNLEISNSIFSGTRGIVLLHNGGTFLIYNNLVYGIDKTAISINRAHGQFFNNTMIGSTPTQHYGVIISSDSVSHIYNNIFDGFGIGIQLAASDSMELSALRIYNNNIYNAAAPYWYEYNENLSLPIFSGALTPNPGTGEISMASDFVDPINGDYNLLSGSPCINAGINNYPFPVNVDLAGNDRIVGANPDIGAYEYSGITGLENHEFKEAFIEMEIYPQPTRDHIWLQFKASYSGVIELLDVSGHILEKIEVKGKDQLKVDLSEYKGLLFLRMTNNEGIEVRRVIKLD